MSKEKIVLNADAFWIKLCGENITENYIVRTVWKGKQKFARIAGRMLSYSEEGSC